MMGSSRQFGGASSMWRVWKEMLKFRLLKPSRFSATCGIISTIQVPVPCDVCGKRCWSFDYLSLHVSLRHVGSSRQFRCQFHVWKRFWSFDYLGPFLCDMQSISTIQVLVIGSWTGPRTLMHEWTNEELWLMLPRPMRFFGGCQFHVTCVERDVEVSTT